MGDGGERGVFAPHLPEYLHVHHVLCPPSQCKRWTSAPVPGPGSLSKDCFLRSSLLHLQFLSPTGSFHQHIDIHNYSHDKINALMAPSSTIVFLSCPENFFPERLVSTCSPHQLHFNWLLNLPALSVLSLPYPRSHSCQNHGQLANPAIFLTSQRCCSQQPYHSSVNILFIWPLKLNMISLFPSLQYWQVLIDEILHMESRSLSGLSKSMF